MTPDGQITSEDLPNIHNHALPMYRCHKEVAAAKVIKVERRHKDDPDTIIVTVEGGFSPMIYDVRYKSLPDVDWYLVQYKGGDISFSPADVFEADYTRIS